MAICNSAVKTIPSFCIAVVIAFVGGRPGMISAATGAMALLMVTLVKEHGLHFQGEIILWAVRWYCKYGISYLNLRRKNELNVSTSVTIPRMTSNIADTSWYCIRRSGLSGCACSVKCVEICS